jgi:hypothetical protein
MLKVNPGNYLVTWGGLDTRIVRVTNREEGNELLEITDRLAKPVSMIALSTDNREIKDVLKRESNTTIDEMRRVREPN